MSFYVKSFVKCDNCGVSSEIANQTCEQWRNKSAKNIGWIVFKRKQFCDETCKEMFIERGGK